MESVLSSHAKGELLRRGILEDDVLNVLDAPGQIVDGYGATKVYQSKMDSDGKTYLLRVIVNVQVDPAVVITVYRTSRIEKYWRTS